MTTASKQMENSLRLPLKLKLFLLLISLNTYTAFAGPVQNGEIAAKQAGANLESACGAKAVFLFKKPSEEKVKFTGFVDDPRDSSSGNMLYPAPSAAGFLGAIIAHAVVSGSIQESQKKAHVEKSNEVLLPFLDVIDTLKSEPFLEAALSSSTAIGSKKIYSEGVLIGSCDFVVELDSLYTITQDKSAMLISNVVKISGKDLGVPYQKIVRVISSPIEQADPVQFLLSDQGAMLKKESINLLRSSIDLSITNFFGLHSNTGASKTVRYRFGTKEKFERAQIIEQGCDQIVFKSLRGELFSVPLALPDEDKMKCKI